MWKRHIEPGEGPSSDYTTSNFANGEGSFQAQTTLHKLVAGSWWTPLISPIVARNCCPAEAGQVAAAGRDNARTPSVFTGRAVSPVSGTIRYCYCQPAKLSSDIIPEWCGIELETNPREIWSFTTTEKASTRTLSLLKAAITAFTFKTFSIKTLL